MWVLFVLGIAVVMPAQADVYQQDGMLFCYRPYAVHDIVVHFSRGFKEAGPVHSHQQVLVWILLVHLAAVGTKKEL
jgi:hypothetical protein